METVKTEQPEDEDLMQVFFIRLQELAMSITEARNLFFSGKTIQGFYKLQGCQARCSSILNQMYSYTKDGQKNGEGESDVVACENPPVPEETGAE